MLSVTRVAGVNLNTHTHTNTDGMPRSKLCFELIISISKLHKMQTHIPNGVCSTIHYCNYLWWISYLRDVLLLLIVFMVLRNSKWNRANDEDISSKRAQPTAGTKMQADSQPSQPVIAKWTKKKEKSVSWCWIRFSFA